MKQKRVLIWSTAVSDLVDGDKAVGGIAVQLYFWAQIFAKKGWQVTTFTHKKTFVKENITFKKVRRHNKLKIVHEWLSVFGELLFVRPQLVISRGAGRISYPLALLSRWCGVTYVFFGASDVNFEPGKELIAGGEHNRKLWQKAVKQIKYIVVQNAHQQETLKKNYQKDSLTLFNLWGDVKATKVNDFKTDVVWVANLRRLKRAEWMVNAAKALPQYDFTIVGGRTGQEPEYYDEIEKISSGISNLHFLGKKNFAETNAIVSKSRLLCCTSTFEGFPNTFLQAWAFGIPVVSTVDPSDVIVTNNLGNTVGNCENFIKVIPEMLENKESYMDMSVHVKKYFKLNHSSETNFEQLMAYVTKL